MLYRDIRPSTKKLLSEFINEWGGLVCIGRIVDTAPSDYALRKYMENFPARWEEMQEACRMRDREIPASDP